MNAWDELVARCATKRREKLGELSDLAYAELVLAVRENPTAFVDDPAEQAFLELCRGLDAYRESRHDDDLLDDDAFAAAHARDLAKLRAACERATRLDEGCLDAHLVSLLAEDMDPDPLLAGLLELEQRFGAEKVGGAGNDAWDNVFWRPRLRLRAAVARACLDGSRYRMAATAAASVTDVTPDDPLGARHTQMLALARLEDEAGLGALEARFSGSESPWSHLARVLLLYKLDRLTAARRALRGYDSLCAGGAYALLRPTYIDLYLPDRPEAAPCSFEECLMAVREAEPIIADVPGFIPWCQSHDWFAESAERFSDENDLGW